MLYGSTLKKATLKRVILDSVGATRSISHLACDQGSTDVEKLTTDVKKVVKVEKTITFHDISFIFNKKNFEINHPSKFTTIDVINSVRCLLGDMSAITHKGFVNVTDLNKLPIYSDFVDIFTVNEKFTVGKEVPETLKWLNSLILASLYKLLLDHSEDPLKLKDYSSDGQADLTVLLKDLFKLIDPSIRKHIQKRGITIIKNIYSGFDTEYKKSKDNELRNDLISVQIATSTKIIIKLPMLARYKLSTIDAQTNKVYEKHYTKKDDEIESSDDESIDVAKSEDTVKGFDFEKIETFFDDICYKIRSKKYPGYDDSMFNLIAGLEGLGLDSMSSDG